MDGTSHLYLGLIIDRKIKRRLNLESIESKTTMTFITVYSVFKRERLSANIKLTLHEKNW